MNGEGEVGRGATGRCRKEVGRGRKGVGKERQRGEKRRGDFTDGYVCNNKRLACYWNTEATTQSGPWTPGFRLAFGAKGNSILAVEQIYRYICLVAIHQDCHLEKKTCWCKKYYSIYKADFLVIRFFFSNSMRLLALWLQCDSVPWNMIICSIRIKSG